MRILVVDDCLVNRSKMEKIATSFGECVAVASGPEALVEFEAALKLGDPFQLVTLDVLMPKMDGAEVLQEMRKLEQHKKVPRDECARVIMVTSSSERDTVLACIRAGCDSYIVKPFDKATIARKLEELGMCPEPISDAGIRGVVMRAFKKFVQGKGGLPVLPRLVQEIQAVTIRPEDASVPELALVIEKDVTISAKVVSMANSAMYSYAGYLGRSSRIYDLRYAIARLGVREIQNIVSALGCRNLYDNEHRLFGALSKKIGLHCLCSAYTCRAIAGRLGEKDCSKFFLLGLTHDIGAALLLKSIGELIDPDTLAFDLDELLESLLDVNGLLGAAILSEWGFEPEFADAAKYHHLGSFDKGTSRDILIVNLAEALSTTMGYGFFCSDPFKSNLEASTILGIDIKALTKLVEEVRAGMKDIEQIFSS